MAFSQQNSARRVVQDTPKWKSRQLDLGNRHRTSLNFGDLVPAYWQHVQPGDKLKMDATILAKFMPLIAPAFSRMRIRSEWFYVPLRQISPSSLRALQDFKPSDAVSAFSEVLQTGKFPSVPVDGQNQQTYEMAGFPSVPAWWLSQFFAFDNVTRVGNLFTVTPYAWSPSHWRTVGVPTSSDYRNTLGLEDFVSFASKFRCAKLASYMGLPTRLSTCRYVRPTYANYIGASYTIDANYAVDNFDSSSISSYNPYYRAMTFSQMVDDYSPNLSVRSSSFVISHLNYGVLSTYLLPFATSSTSTSMTIDVGSADFPLPCPSTSSSSLISLLPFQAYQKIFNDFYRDEKLQPDEIRFYPYSHYSENLGFVYAGFNTYSRSTISPTISGSTELMLSPWCPVIGSAGKFGPTSIYRLINNLFSLRRRNRSKDVLTSCVTDKVLVNRLSNSSTAPNVFQSNLFSKVERYLMKKEFTGSTWAEWLSNFFGENSNDYLNNNVIFLGQKESVVSISENIQTSESTENSAQGNRGGLAADFHNGNSIYFRVPDFGIVMCVVSVIPDDIDNFNGLQERFERYSPWQFNLPDLQNLGFSPVFNRRANIGFSDRHLSVVVPSYSIYPPWFGNTVFGYQPFGYEHTYTPDVISGDLTQSLRYWHQSPDLDFDFVDGLTNLSPVSYYLWSGAQPNLNPNLPVIGMRQIPVTPAFQNQYYNNIFAVTNDVSGDHIVADMRFFVTCHRNTAFFTDAIEEDL